MPRNSVSQPQRTQNNPLNLGTFNQTALRYLKGSLGPEWKVVGRADTNQTSNGGIGGGTFNHWFVVTLAKPGWIILTKGPPRPKYIQVSAYDVNKTPIQGEAIFDADSIHSQTNRSVYIPYLDTVMQAQSDLYNTFERLRLDRGDDRYYPLSAGSYLICISSTRNEPLNYELGVVIEFPTYDAFFELEDADGSVCLQETEIDAPNIDSPIAVDTLVPPGVNAFTDTICQINAGITMTISEGSTWYIGERIPAADYDDYKIILEVGDDAYYDTIHDHSLSEWQDAWEREHQDTDRFPDLFTPLTNRP
jgi:hypothetical protein